MDDGITGGTNASIKSFLKCLNAFNGGKEPVGVEVNPGAPNPLHGAIRADGEKTLDELLKVSSSLTSPEERRYESIFKIFKRVVFPEPEAEKLKALSAQKKTASPVADRINQQSLATPKSFKDSIKDDILASIIGSALVAGAGALLAKGGLITALASKIPGIKSLPSVKEGAEKRKKIKAEKAEKRAQKKAAKGPRKPIPIPRVLKKGRLSIIGRTIERFSKAKPAVAPTKTTPGTTLGSKPRARSGSLKRQKTSPIAAPKTPQASALDKAVKQPKATKTRLRGKGLGMVGTVLGAAAIGDILIDETLTTKGKTKEIAETGGGMAGGAAGAAAGAAMGAAIGSIIPGIGTAIGGVVGGILGSIGGYDIGEKVTGAAFTAVAGEEGLTQDPAALLEAKNKLEQERVDKSKEAKFKSAVKIYGEANVERDESGRGYRIKDKEYAMPQAAIKKQLDLSSDASPDYAAYMEFESLKAKQREARDKIMKAISEGEEPSEALQKSKELADLAVEIQKKKLVDIIKAKKETVKPEQKTPEASKVSSASAKSFAISAPTFPSRPEILGTGAIQKVTKEGEPAHIVIDGKKYGEETDQYKAHETYLKQIADWTKVREKFDDIKVAVSVGLSLNDRQVLLEDFDKSQKEYNAKYNIDTPKTPQAKQAPTPQAKQIQQTSTLRVDQHINFRGDPYLASEGSAPALPGENITLKGSKEFPIPVYTPATVLPANYSMTTAPGKEHVVDRDTGQKYGPDSDVYKAAWRKKEFDEIKHQAGEKRVFNRTSSEDYNEWLRGKLKPWHGGNMPAPLTGKDREQLNKAKLSILKAMNEPLPGVEPAPTSRSQQAPTPQAKQAPTPQAKQVQQAQTTKPAFPDIPLTEVKVDPSLFDSYDRLMDRWADSNEVGNFDIYNEQLASFKIQHPEIYSKYLAPAPQSQQAPTPQSQQAPTPQAKQMSKYSAVEKPKFPDVDAVEFPEHLKNNIDAHLELDEVESYWLEYVNTNNKKSSWEIYNKKLKGFINKYPELGKQLDTSHLPQPAPTPQAKQIKLADRTDAQRAQDELDKVGFIAPAYWDNRTWIDKKVDEAVEILQSQASQAKQAPTPQAKQVQQALTPEQKALLKKADEWDLNAKQLRISASRNKNESLKRQLNTKADQAAGNAAELRKQAYMSQEAILNTKESRSMREGPSILERGDSLAPAPQSQQAPTPQAKQVQQTSKEIIKSTLLPEKPQKPNTDLLSGARNLNLYRQELSMGNKVYGPETPEYKQAVAQDQYVSDLALYKLRVDSINKPNKPESPAVASKKTGYYSKIAIDPQRKDIAPNIYTKTHNTFQASQQPRQDKPRFYSPYLGRRELPTAVAQPRSEKRIEKPVLEKQGMQADAGISSMSGLINKHYTDIKNINEKLFGAAVEQIELLRVIASNTAGGNSKAAPTIITQGKSGGDAYTRTLNIRNDFLTS